MVSKKEKYLASAQKFIERGQLDKALAEFTKVVQEDPKDTRTLLKMAEIHAKRGSNVEATEIYLRTGDLYADQGFAQKAVAVYKNVLKLSPGMVAAHLKVAALFNQLGLVSDAVQQFELAATALERAGKSADAVAALRQAVDIQPENVVLRVRLAESASHAGLVDDAVRAFAQAADHLKAQGRVDESLRVMERLLFHQPGNFAKARELAEAYIAKGTPRLALPKLQACLNGDPRDPRTLSLLARALEQMGQVPKAVSVLKELVRLCDELGRGTERDAAVLRGLTLDPSDDELRSAAARHHLGGSGASAGEATPPPVVASDTRLAAGSFDLSGRVPVSSASGRVSVAVGLGDTARGQLSGVSLGVEPDVDRMLAEADVFVKYGLLERAADHLARVFEFEPERRDAREKLIGVLQRLGRTEAVAHHGAILAQQMASASLAASDPPDPSPPAVAVNDDSVAPAVFVDGGGSSSPYQSMAIAAADPTAEMVTPPPVPHRPAPLAAPSSETEMAIASDAEFDAEVRTGDVLLASPTTVNHDGDAPERPLEHPRQGGDDAKTPPLARRTLAVVSARDVPGSQASDDREDPAFAFSEEVATVASDADLVATALAEFDENELAADLEQVSFFLDQAMWDEARSALRDLEGRFPHNPLVAVKSREMQAFDSRSTALARESVSTARIMNDPTLGTNVIERRVTLDAPRPRAVVSGGGASDASTHADLAIAYKGMGLFDAAIAELKLLGEDADREVFALTTMGECFEAKHSFTEAIIRYKRALNCEQITPQETLVLYFLLGVAFERLGDVSEALYFFEKVLKRDSKFRDVDLKVSELRPRLVKRAR